MVEKLSNMLTLFFWQLVRAVEGKVVFNLLLAQTFGFVNVEMAAKFVSRHGPCCGWKRSHPAKFATQIAALFVSALPKMTACISEHAVLMRETATSAEEQR
jgi:hypothetical protein